jgi:hypothetical protein
VDGERAEWCCFVDSLAVAAVKSDVCFHALCCPLGLSIMLLLRCCCARQLVAKQCLCWQVQRLECWAGIAAMSSSSVTKLLPALPSRSTAACDNNKYMCFVPSSCSETCHQALFWQTWCG